MKSILGFIIFVIAVIALLFSFSGKRYSRIPSDESHKGITDISACMECHGPEKKNALKQSHPPKYECFKCHKVKRAKTK